MKKTMNTVLSAAEPTIRKITLNSGHVNIYEGNKITLHAYATEDALSNEAYIVEGEEALVGIELPSFTAGLEIWKQYVESLKKPMRDIFIVNHPAGASYIKGMNIYGTQNAKDSIAGGAVHAITEGLHKAFGEDFHGGNDTAVINNILPGGKTNIAGIDFKIIDRGSDYDIEIPEINAIYTHMLGQKVHSIITSKEHMKSMLNTLKEYQNAGYNLILSAHAEPEGQDAVAEKIAYIKKMQKLSEEKDNAAEFKSAMKKEFPDYAGENYLEMTVGALYSR